MDICIVTDELVGPFRNGDIGTANTGLAEVATSLGHKVSVLYTNHIAMDGKLPEWQNRYRKIGIELHALPKLHELYQSPERPSISLEVYNWLKIRSFDLIIFDEYNAPGYSSLTAKKLGVAFQNTQLSVYTHGSHAWLRELQKTLYRSIGKIKLSFMEQRCVEMADFVISPSRHLLDWMTSKGWKLGDHRVVPPSMPTQQFRQRLQNIVPSQTEIQGEQPSLKEAMPASELVFFGRLELRKGLPLFLNALEILLKRLPKEQVPQVTFMGKFARIENLHTGGEILYRMKNWPNQIRLISDFSQPQAIEYLKKPGRLAVIASRLDNSPCTVHESIQEAISFVASNNGGIPEIVHPDDHEEVLFDATPKALADKLESAIRNGIKVARPANSEAQIRENWKNLFDTLADRSTTARSQTAVFEPLSKIPSQCPEWYLVKSSSIVEQGPMISVIIPHYNRPQLLKRALESLEQQSYRNFEIIVVDDGSTMPEATAYLQEIENGGAESRIRVMRQVNRYVGAARNTGAAAAQGEYLMFMDDDNIALPFELECFVKAAQKSNADVITCLALLFDDNDIHKKDLYIHPIIGPCAEAGLLDNVFGDANFFVKRSVFQKLGGFLELRDSAWLDYHILFKAVLEGFKLELLPEPLYLYRRSIDSMLFSTTPFDDAAPILELTKKYELSLFGPALDLLRTNNNGNHEHRNSILLEERPNSAWWIRLQQVPENGKEAKDILATLFHKFGRSEDAGNIQGTFCSKLPSLPLSPEAELQKARKKIKDLEKSLMSAEQWQKRSWTTRAFHKWRQPAKSKSANKVSKWEKLKHSIKKRICLGKQETNHQKDLHS